MLHTLFAISIINCDKIVASCSDLRGRQGSTRQTRAKSEKKVRVIIGQPQRGPFLVHYWASPPGASIDFVHASRPLVIS